MEIDDKKDELEGSAFRIQVSTVKDKRSLKIIAECILKLKSEDSLGKASLVKKSEAIEKSLTKLKEGTATKVAVQTMRKIFYVKTKSQNDYEEEKEQINERNIVVKGDDKDPNVQKIVYEICLKRYDELLKAIQLEENRKLLADIAEEAKKEKEKASGNQNSIIDEEVKEKIKFADLTENLLNEVVDLASESAKKYKKKKKKKTGKKKKKRMKIIPKQKRKVKKKKKKLMVYLGKRLNLIPLKIKF